MQSQTKVVPEGHDLVLVSSKTLQVTEASSLTWGEAIGGLYYTVWLPATLDRSVALCSSSALWVEEVSNSSATLWLRNMPVIRDTEVAQPAAFLGMNTRLDAGPYLVHMSTPLPSPSSAFFWSHSVLLLSPNWGNNPCCPRNCHSVHQKELQRNKDNTQHCCALCTEKTVPVKWLDFPHEACGHWFSAQVKQLNVI